MKYEKGFVMVEAVIAFSIFLLLTLSILPFYIHLKQQRANLDREYMARTALYNELLYQTYNSHHHSSSTTNFMFTFQNVQGGKRGCVSWYTFHGKEKKVCEVLFP
ncbi:type II secretion system protein [Priestia endophytica]|uniref:type II secretion system protein n=1 Tax=Priestia endophytica TaxID=135735 RepID=UPI00227ED4C3|nr:type II secretion system protein [Priestia endophytica]MCY8232943.1 type II secretion system GspH family protein [Priestia endophytica]